MGGWFHKDEDISKQDECYKLKVVILCLHCGDLSGYEITTGVIGGSRQTLPNVIRPCRMIVLQSGPLDMSRSLYLTISYLLKDERKDLESKSQGWIGNIRIEN